MSKSKRPRGGKKEFAAQDLTINDSPTSGDEAASFVNPHAPLPRPKRQRRRAKADRGLPHDDELMKLAEAYLKRQSKHWPMVFDAGLLPVPSPMVLSQMVDEFKQRHRTGKIDFDTVRPFTTFGVKLAGNYDRYSCDNSDPTSVLDQMVKSLDKARAEDRLVPWQYIFADYSVTGLDSSRQGYSSYKKVLEDAEHLIESTYIDDFTRASRDTLEWWKLASLSKRLHKRMIGASDGFDLNSPDWDIKITIYGLLSRLFIKSLREKVKRGMSGAAERGTCVGKLTLGFTRRAHCDEHGNAVVDVNGQPIYEPCIDPETREARLLMYRLYVEESLSAYEIQREFNRRKIDGWNGWTARGIKQLLWNPDAIGVFIWNRTRKEFDYEEEKWIDVPNPRSEWKVRYAPELALAPQDLWRAARRKLAASRRASPLTGKKKSRNEVSATTLFSGTLFCDYCGAELKLNRSTLKYKQTACLSGLAGAHDCKLSTSKSTHIVEDCLLAYLRDNILTEANLEGLVARSNAHLATEAEKPQVDTKPWKADVRKLQAKIDKLVRLVEEEEDESLCVAQNNRVKELQREVISTQGKIRAAEGDVRKAVKPLPVVKAKQYLVELRKTLSAEIPMAAEAIRAITGPIRVRQEIIPGRPGARWIATFSPDLLRAIRCLDHGKWDVPTANSIGSSSMPAVEIPLEKVPQYERLAPLFKQLHADGASVNAIAAAHGMCWKQANDILQFALTGKRPVEKPRPKKRKGEVASEKKKKKYPDIRERVVELREKKKLSFVKIAAMLNVSGNTVRRAYDAGRPDAVREAVAGSREQRRGTYSHLGEETFEQIRKMLRAGKSPTEIVKKLGCGKSTVYRVKTKMESEGGDEHAA